MLNPREFEIPPPGAGLKTVIWAVPTLMMSLAGIAATNSLMLTNVGRLLPFHRTTEPGRRFDPLTVSANAGPPAPTLVGTREVITGTGLPMLNTSEIEIPPPGAGLKTDICALPAMAISAPEIVAINCVLLTNVVGRALRFH